MFWITHQKQNPLNYVDKAKSWQFSGAIILNFIFTFNIIQSQNTKPWWVWADFRTRAILEPLRRHDWWSCMIGTGIFDTLLLSVAGYRSRNMNQTTDIWNWTGSIINSWTQTSESTARIYTTLRAQAAECGKSIESKSPLSPPGFKQYINRWGTVNVAYSLFISIGFELLWSAGFTYHLRFCVLTNLWNVINPDQSNQNNTVSFHQYADDTQLYIGTNSSVLTTQIASIESCTQRVHNWLLNNGLHLNPSKSEAIAFYNPRSKPLAALAESIGTVSVAGSPIKLQTSIKNLGVYIDSKMSFDKQVSETCKACYFHIRALRHICASISYYWGFS